MTWKQGKCRMTLLEHRLFCQTLSDGKDSRDCGRPCDTHRVDLRDRVAARDLLDRYSRVLAGQDNPRTAFRQLKVLNQLGVTRGTLEG